MSAAKCIEGSMHRAPAGCSRFSCDKQMGALRFEASNIGHIYMSVLRVSPGGGAQY